MLFVIASMVIEVSDGNRDNEGLSCHVLPATPSLNQLSMQCTSGCPISGSQPASFILCSQYFVSEVNMTPSLE